jgi:nanoRNase/pAp phosphatase (c-di-AMP/oligoRNAs hydrolase)
MNFEIDKTNQILDLIKGAKSITIMPFRTAGMDAFSASVGLYYMLRNEGKDVSIIYQGAVPEEFADNKDINVQHGSGQRELVVSVDYSNTDASKVNYSTENDVLHFSISPVDRDFDISRIKFELKGFNSDLIITVGAQSREDLGADLENIGGGFGESDILNIDNTEGNDRFGSINIVDPTSKSLCLLTLNIGVKWGLDITDNAAEALLKGISRKKF